METPVNSEHKTNADEERQFHLTITPEQKVQLDGLNAVWDRLSSAEGLAGYRVILGREGLATVLEAMRTGRKVMYTVEASSTETCKPPFAADGSPPNVKPDKQERFHAHLDICAQCADNPFSLCPVGHSILIGS